MVDATVASSEPVSEPSRVVPLASRRRGPNVGAWGAVAAAAVFAISTGTLGAQNAAMRGELRSDGSAMQAMVRSHFVHAQFASPEGKPVDAKVIYERHGRWYEILALGADPSWRVRVVRDGTAASDLSQRFTTRGDVGMVVLAGMGPVRSFELFDARGTLVGSVHPALAAEETALQTER
jgi:hypothetical protein